MCCKIQDCSAQKSGVALKQDTKVIESHSNLHLVYSSIPISNQLISMYLWHCVISDKSLNAVEVLKECCVHIFLTAPRRWPSVWFTLCFRLPWVYPSAAESAFILFSRFLPEFYTYSFHIKNLGHMGCSADLIYFRAKITSPDITLFSSFLFISFIPIILKT